MKKTLILLAKYDPNLNIFPFSPSILNQEKEQTTNSIDNVENGSPSSILKNKLENHSDKNGNVIFGYLPVCSIITPIQEIYSNPHQKDENLKSNLTMTLKVAALQNDQLELNDRSHDILLSLKLIMSNKETITFPYKQFVIPTVIES